MSNVAAMADYETVEIECFISGEREGSQVIRHLLGIRGEFEPIADDVSVACASPDDMGEPYVFLDFTDVSGDRACGNFSPLAARALAAQLLKAARWAEGDRT